MGQSLGADTRGMRLQFLDEDYDPRQIVIEDADQVLTYLHEAALLRCAIGRFPDTVDPARTFRNGGEVTDGRFVWPQAVAYYVSMHRLAPPEALLAHIRAQGYRCRTVTADEAHRATRVLRRRRG